MNWDKAKRRSNALVRLSRGQISLPGRELEILSDMTHALKEKRFYKVPTHLSQQTARVLWAKAYAAKEQAEARGHDSPARDSGRPDSTPIGAIAEAQSDPSGGYSVADPTSAAKTDLKRRTKAEQVRP